MQQKASLFDHLVGGEQQPGRHGQADRFCGFEVEYKLEFGRLLNRDFTRPRPAQNFVDIIGGAPPQIGEVGSIGHQASRFHAPLITVHRRQARGSRQSDNLGCVARRQRVSLNLKCADADLERLEGGGDILGSPDFKGANFEAQCLGRRLNLVDLQNDDGIVDVGHDCQLSEVRDNLA